MPRYYLDLHHNMDVYRDVEGREFESDAKARMGAVRLLIDTLADLDEVGTTTRLFVITARRADDNDAFAAVSTRITSLR